MNSIKRRSLLIHKDLQFRITAQILILVLCSNVLIGGTIYVVLWRGLTNPAFIAGERSISSIFNNMHVLLFVIVAAICLGVMWISIVISHKIAGPLLRLSNQMKQLSEGRWEIDPVKFRKDDELHQLAEQFNAMTAAVKSKIATDGNKPS